MPIFWQIRNSAFFFKTPDTDPKNPAAIATTFDSNAGVEIVGAVLPDNPDWVKVNITDLPEGQGVFARAAELVQAENPPRIPLDIQTFVEMCTVACEVYNQSSTDQQIGVSRDYLIAVAAIMNGAQRLGFTPQMMPAFDPYKFTADEWARFCASPANTSAYKDYDRVDGLAQIDAALARAAQSVSALNGAFAPGAPEAKVQPPDTYIPDGMQLFLAQMLGDAAAITALKDKAGGVGSKLWSQYVLPADIAALRQKYPDFFKVDTVDTLDDLLNRIEDAFGQAYTAAAKVVSDAKPQEKPPIGTPTPWIDVALKELGVGGQDRRILDYLATTDYGGPLDPRPAWCAAFVTFCMKQSGQLSPPHEQAGVKVWAKWGSPVGATGQGEIPKGAVVVLSQSKDIESFSHVAFYWSDDGVHSQNILLLGGNQGHPGEVNNHSSWPRTHIAAVRWPGSPPQLFNAANNVTGPVPSPPTEIGIGLFTPADWALYCDVLGKRKSTNNYRRVNPYNYAGRWQFGALALCDTGYVKANSPQRSLQLPQFWIGTDGIGSQAEWLNSPRVQDKAMLVLTRLNYLKLKNVVDASRPKAEIAGYLAAAHLTGVGGATKLSLKQLSHDANGVTSQDYYNLLSGAFAGR